MYSNEKIVCKSIIKNARTQEFHVSPSSSAKISVICLSGSLACAVTIASLEHFLPRFLAETATVIMLKSDQIQIV